MISVKSQSFAFECLGVKIKISSNESKLLRRTKSQLSEIFPGYLQGISAAANSGTEHYFSLHRDRQTKKVRVFKEGEVLFESNDNEDLTDLFTSHLRLTVAEFAEEFAFLHAGVIGWRKKAIVIPGKSFAGKTTLVAEFLKYGCEYFSDEYALIDKNGMIYPFPKKLSMRGIIDDYRQVDLEARHFGGKIAKKQLPLGVLLVTAYDKSAGTSLKEISKGEGIMAALSNSISVRRNPNFVIKVLSKAIDKSIILQSRRGEASAFVRDFFNYLEDR